MNSRRISLTQLKTIVKYLEENPDLARGRAKTSEGNHRTKVQWHELAKKLNAIEGGVVKSSKAWAKYWADKKCLLKKALLKRNRQLKSGTVGKDATYISPLDVRLMTLLNMEGLVNETADPLPVNVTQEFKEEYTDEMPYAVFESSSSSVADDEDPPPSPDSPPTISQITVKPEGLSQKRNRKKQDAYDVSDSLQNEWNRLAEIEEKRIAAELLAAEAQKEFSVALTQSAAALESLAGAIRSQGVEIVEALRANGQVISDALQAQGKVIAEALQKRNP